MGKGSIHGVERTVRKMFSDDYVFSIPPYQRPYCWTIDEAGELLDDIITCMNSNKELSEEVIPYFLGSIVLIKNDEPNALVVDGQQRLTTLTMLLSTLRTLIKSEQAKDLTNFLYEKGNTIAGTPDRYRLKLRDRDAKFFKTYIQAENGIQQLQTIRQEELPESQKNIRDNTLKFVEELQKVPEDQRIALSQFIINHCFLVIVSTSDLNSAYRIFTVLNNRGVNLSYTDILKADIIHGIPSEEQENYTTRWEEMEDVLGRDTFEDLFFIIRSLYRREKLRKTMLEEFREYVYPTPMPTMTSQVFIEDVLLPYGRDYRIILKADYRSTNNKRTVEINNLLRWLNRIDLSSWMVPALLYFRQNRSDPDTLLRFLSHLECLAASLMIRKIPSNKRIDRFIRLVHSIHNNTDLYSEDSPLLLSFAEKREVFRILDGDIYNLRGGVCSYVLLRLDTLLSDNAATYNHNVITIEHVLPLKPASNSDWVKHFSSMEHKRWVNRLGNLVLLSRTKNALAKNFDFAIKKEKYFSSQEGVSSFILTSRVLLPKEWTPEIVEKRQRDLMSRLSLHWGL